MVTVMNRKPPARLAGRAVPADRIRDGWHVACRGRFPVTVLLFTFLVFLGGCVHSTKAQFTGHYGLGTPASVPATDSGAANANGKILQVSQISVPDWLSGNGMFYRLDYRNDDRLAAYGQSDWISPPASLLEPILRRALAGGGWRAVIGPRDPATADASLQLRLDDFSQAFAEPGQSKGVLDATATLIDNHDDNVIAQEHFHIEVPAATPDAEGGAKALAEASRKFATQLRGWAQAAAER
jgi:cholesterol transport system auxiliary component